MDSFTENSDSVQLSGMVVRIIFSNPDNGFGVFQLQPHGAQNTLTVTGLVGELDAGEYVSLNGRWVDRAGYGRQIQAESIRTTLPDSLEGLERYLGSGIIHGIGPATAKKITETFGEKTRFVLDSQSHRLNEVKGLGKNKSELLRQFWNQKENSRSLLLFLSEHQVGIRLGTRIQKALGEDALNIIKDNPFSILKVPGIAFPTADRIALRVGEKSDSPRRIEHALFSGLESATMDGHSCLPEMELIDKTCQLLSLPPFVVGNVLKELIVQEKLIFFSPFVQTPRLRKLELEIARHVAKLCHRAPVLGFKEGALAQSLAKNGFKLHEEQQRALVGLCQNGFSILTGGPGVGKTTLLRAVVNYFQHLGIEPVLAAPTGRAAQRLQEASSLKASTLHRLLKYHPHDLECFGHNHEKPLEGELFIVDEFSMVDLEIFHAFLEALPPFAQLILVGDPNQLPSVGAGRLLGDMIESGKVASLTLNHIHRQHEGSRLVLNAHRLLKREMPLAPPTGETSDFYHIEKDSVEQTLSTLNILISQRIAKAYGLSGAKNIQVLSPLKRGPLGTVELNHYLQGLFNPKGEQLPSPFNHFRIGDKVLQQVNNYELEIFNGDQGFILRSDESGVWIDFDGQEVLYPKENWTDLLPAYACTVHKSQGSEFPVVLLPLYEGHVNFASLELIYTAITRARKLCVLIGPIRILESILHRPNRPRYSHLGHLLKKMLY